MRNIFVVAACLLVASSAFSAEDKVRLKDGPGLQQVQANCIACHSLDYIPLNSVFLDRKGWEAEVTKMIKAYGAPVKEADIPAIVEYLTREYGAK